jgi:hypothetical protein
MFILSLIGTARMLGNKLQHNLTCGRSWLCGWLVLVRIQGAGLSTIPASRNKGLFVMLADTELLVISVLISQ